MVDAAYVKVMGKAPEWPDIHWGYSEAVIHDGSIGVTFLPTEKYNPDHAIVAVHPKSRENEDYTREIVRHELIHTAIGDDPIPHHGSRFKELARAAGLPEKYTD